MEIAQTLISLLFYLAIFSFAGISLYFGNKYNKKWPVIVGLFALIAIAAFRYNTGIDYANYVDIFDRLVNRDVSYFMKSYSFEFILFFFVKISNLFTLKYVVFFGLYSALTIIPFYFGIKKISKDKAWLGVLLYALFFFAPSLNGIRQFAAISIVFYGTATFLESMRPKYQKIFFFIMSILFASLAHTSAICAILILPFIYVLKTISNMSNRKIIILSIVGTILMLFLEYFVVQNISSIPFLSRYSAYFRWSLNDVPMPNLIPKLFLVLLSILTLPNLLSDKKFSSHNIFYYFMSFVTIITAAIGFFVPYGFRISDYFFIFQIPLFIKIIDTAPKNDKRLYVYLFIAYGIIFFLYSAMLNNSHGIFPYQLI